MQTESGVSAAEVAVTHRTADWARIEEKFQAMTAEIDRRKFLNYALGGILSAPAILPFRSYAFRTDADFTAVRERIRKEVATGSPASFAVAVAANGKVIWKEAYGWADVKRRIPATLKTRYALSSVSKPFTATAIMTLAERGLLDLDTSLGKHIDGLGLKEFGGDAAAITPRHLLLHTSGLPRHWRCLYSDEDLPIPDFRETIRRYGIITSMPGTEYLYSNLGYGLLAHVAENITRKPFAQFVGERVFRPLGLKATTIENRRLLTRSAAAFYNADGSQVPYYAVDEWGSQRVFSTIGDLIRFGMFHLNNSSSGQQNPLSKRTIERMQAEQYRIDGSDSYSSLGWQVREKGPHNYLQVVHSGDAPGVSAQLMLLPANNIAIAVLSNTRFAELIYTATDDIMDSLLPANKEMRENDPSLKSNSTVPTPIPSTELLGTWEGEVTTYMGKIPVSMTIKPDGDVHFKLDEQLPTQISSLQIAGEKLSGRCSGTITTDEAMRRPHQIRLALKHERNTISGTVHAQSSIDSVAIGLPRRDYFALANWIKLTKRESISS